MHWSIGGERIVQNKLRLWKEMRETRRKGRQQRRKNNKKRREGLGRGRQR